jgi:hypothetical protein
MMQDNNLYRPTQGSLLDSRSKPRKRISIGKRFLITLYWAFPIFAIISVLNTEMDQWFAVIAGSFLIALFCSLVAMCIPTRYKIIFVPVGVLAGFGLVLLSASH